MHPICMSTRVCPASRNPQQMHKLLFLPRDRCMAEEDLLEKPECRLLFSQATVFGTETFMEELCVLWFLLLCFTVDQGDVCGLGG